MNEIVYPIHERFATFQGEGAHMGRSAFFVRTYGCPVQCPWCDSAGTWHPKWVPKEVKRMTAHEIVCEVRIEGIDRIVVTGGEPAIHNLAPLVNECHHHNILAHLETSGAFPIRGNFDWITLSPKRWRFPLRETVQQADEFKIIVENPLDIDFYYGMLLGLGMDQTEEVPIWLHPEWSKRNDPVVLEAIADAVKKGPTFRAGWQLHKLYQVDKFDRRSRAAVPLGGDPARGL